MQNRILQSIATHNHHIELSYDGVSDYVKDWLKTHRDVTEELEKATTEAVAR